MRKRGRKSGAELATPLRVVAPLSPIRLASAPDHLQPETQQWWDNIVANFDLEDHHLRLLEAACDAWDRLTASRATLLVDGLTTLGRDATLKAHPCVAIERDARIAFARLLRELDLDVPPPEDRGYRPPGLRSNRRL
jgi:P27 family predicted phage terminase small subunit